LSIDNPCAGYTISITTATETTMNRAQWDAAFAGDGQRFSTVDGVPMEEFAAGVGGASRERRTVRTLDCTLYHLEDSTVVVCGDAWDYQHPDCTCGCCWEGADDPRCLAGEEHWCHGCGDVVPDGDETWHDGDCYCPGCAAAPAEDADA
jgi:hypothetical protein